MKTFRIYELLILLIIIIGVFIGCKKNYNAASDIAPTAIPVNASLSGRILDENHQPVSNANVTSGTVTTQTDINGYFQFKNILIKNPGAALLRVDKDGFFPGVRVYQSSDGSSDYVVALLVKKITAGTFPATSGGTVIIPNNGGRIDFLPGGIVNSTTNAVYSGTVSAAAFFISPLSTDFLEMMPGGLLGINMLNQQKTLQSYGMITVELTGSNNEKLQLAPGKSASLTFPIGNALQSNAPATVPLWSFTDSSGFWKEEGVAIKQGTNYVGSVSHFSSWNCDYPASPIGFKAKIVDQNGKPLSHVKTAIKTIGDNNFTSGYGYTDSTGTVNCSIPANINLQLLIYNQCGDVVLTKNIGPYSSATNLGTIIVNLPSQAMVRFIGSVTNCSGALVTSGSVTVSIDNNFYLGAITNGNFNFSILRCSKNSTTASIIAVDNSTLIQSSALQLTVNDTLISTGTMQACGVITNEFLTYTFNGVTRSFTIPPDSVWMVRSSGNQYSIAYGRKTNQTPNDHVFIMFPATSSVSSNLLLTETILGNVDDTYIYPGSQAGNGPLTTTINITENGAYLAANYTVTLVSNNNKIYPFSAKFRLKVR